jgi:hypothetical protein
MPKYQLRELERSTLEYLQSVTRELTQMARAGRFPAIAYFLEMGYIEISDVLRGEVAPRPSAAPQPSAEAAKPRAPLKAVG